MKKIFLLTIITLLIVPILVKADDVYYINNGNTTITADEYQNLLNLGFEQKEIYGMSIDEFETNNKLKGEIIKKTTLELTEFPQLSLNPDDNFSGGIAEPCNWAYAETQYKKMNTYIININNNHYRYKITLEWKIMPGTRCWDIIALGHESSVYVAIPTTFNQEWCKSGSCYSSLAGNYYSYDEVEMVSFKIPTGTLTSLNSYMYYDVLRVDPSKVLERITTIGDYAHATRSLSNSLNKSDIDWMDEIWLTNHAIYYDDIPATELSQLVNWGAW